MKKRDALSLFLVSLICTTGCSASITGGTEASQEPGASLEQSADDESSESTAETIESAETTSVFLKETDDDTGPDETEKAVAGTEDIFGGDGQRLYNVRIERAPDCVYSAEEWLSDDGRLLLPFDENEATEHDGDLDFSFGRYYIPAEAIEAASTGDLLSICTDTFFAQAVVCFDKLDFQVQYLADNLNAVDAVFARADFAEVLLGAYQEDTLVLQTADSDEANVRACAVITEELFLARNEVFEQMTDELREKTLSEVMKKQELIESGEYDYSIYGSSCFFYYMEDLYNNGNGKWHEYIEKNHPEYLKYCEYGGGYYP